MSRTAGRAGLPSIEPTTVSPSVGSGWTLDRRAERPQEGAPSSDRPRRRRPWCSCRSRCSRGARGRAGRPARPRAMRGAESRRARRRRPGGRSASGASSRHATSTDAVYGSAARAPGALSCDDRAPRRDPAARGPQRLPPRADREGRGRRRPAADAGTASGSRGRHALVRLAAPCRRATGRTRSPCSSPGSPSACRRRRGPSADVAVHRVVRSRALDRHVPVDGRGAGAGDRRGRAGARRARRIARPAATPDGDPGAAPRALGATGSPRRKPRRRRWIRDADRRVPVVSISGTNGKTTVTRLITHILARAGRHVGTTTSDGVYVDERLVEAGDWTGPGGARRSWAAADVDVAVLETARGGILLRGVGYESNEASVLTNVSSDHLDLQGIHTLPELGRGQGDDLPDHPAATAGSSSTPTTRSSPRSRPTGPRPGRPVPLDGRPAASVRRHVAAGGRATSCGAGRSSRSRTAQARADRRRRGRADHDRRARPAQRRQRARGRRRRPGPRGDDRAGRATGSATSGPTADRSPGRLNLFRLGGRIVIVDFAHNEAGLDAVLDVAEGIAAGAAGPGGADHGHHRDGRRPPGRHAPRDRPDRRPACPDGWPSRRRQEYLRGRTREHGRRRAARRGRRGRPDRPTRSPSTRRRRRRCARSSTAPRPRAEAADPVPDAARVVVLHVPRGARRRLRPPRRARCPTDRRRHGADRAAAPPPGSTPAIGGSPRLTINGRLHAATHARHRDRGLRRERSGRA